MNDVLRYELNHPASPPPDLETERLEQLELLSRGFLLHGEYNVPQWLFHFRARRLFPGLRAADVRTVFEPLYGPVTAESRYTLAQFFHTRHALRALTDRGRKLREQWRQHDVPSAYVRFSVTERKPGHRTNIDEYICPDAKIVRVSKLFVSISGEFRTRRNGSSKIRKIVPMTGVLKALDGTTEIYDNRRRSAA